MTTTFDRLRITRQTWMRVLLAALGGGELLMAAGASSTTLIVGITGGAALVAAACCAPRRRRTAASLMVAGTLPFAVAAWTALVPILVVLVTTSIAAPVLRAPTEPAPAG